MATINALGHVAARMWRINPKPFATHRAADRFSKSAALSVQPAPTNRPEARVRKGYPLRAVRVIVDEMRAFRFLP